jgi:hypothetical protein
VKEAFKEAMSRFAAGVTVVSARHGEERGMTATAFMSLSLEPPLVALGIAKKARLFPLLEASGAFAVSLLREGQEAIAEHFAGKPQEGVAWWRGPFPGLWPCSGAAWRPSTRRGTTGSWWGGWRRWSWGSRARPSSTSPGATGGPYGHREGGVFGALG